MSISIQYRLLITESYQIKTKDGCRVYTFQNIDQADKFSECLKNLGIVETSGHKKYVAQHVQGDAFFGVFLTQGNIQILKKKDLELINKIALALEGCYSKEEWKKDFPSTDINLKDKFKVIMTDENKLKKFLFNLRNLKIDSMKDMAEGVKNIYTIEDFFEQAEALVREPTSLGMYGLGFVQSVARAVIKTD